MKVNFLVNFFKSENPERKKELDFVLQQNILNSAIDRTINFSARPTYEDFFMEGFSFPKDINIIANTDIFTDEGSINLIRKFYENTANHNTVMALSRWDVDNSGRAKHYNDRGSQDVWVFYGNILPLIKHDCKFNLGKPGCDNRIAYILKDSGFNVVNPSLDIRFYHLHNSGFRNYELKDTILGNHLLISATMIHSMNTTEYLERTHEQVANDINYKISHPDTIQLNIPPLNSQQETSEVSDIKEGVPEIIPVKEEVYKPHTTPRSNQVYRGEPAKPVNPVATTLQLPIAPQKQQAVISIPSPSFEKVTNKGIRILHLAVMAGDNGFTKKFQKLANEFYEINVPHIKASNGYDYLQANIVSLADKVKPDLIFCQLQEDGLISKETFQKIKNNCPNSVIITWSGDIRHETPKFIKDLLFSKSVDVACYSNMRDVKELQRFGNSEFLNIGFDPEIYRSGISVIEGSIHKVCFMANNYGGDHFPLTSYRREVVETLYSELRGEFGLFGTGWEKYNQVGALNQQLESTMYNTCKVAISVSHFNEERYFSDRLIRAMGSGVMVLSHNYSGIEKDFVVGEHLDVFNDLNELKEKVRYYLNNPSEALRIGKAGTNLVHGKHTFSDMINNIYSIYEKYKKQNTIS